MPRVCGLTRCSLVKQVDSSAVQISQILEGAQRLGLPIPEILSEPPGTSGVSTVFRKRPEGRKLWHNLQKNDILIVAKLDRLGRNCRDIRSTLDHFQDKGVRIVILDLFGGQGIDLNGPIGQIIVTIMSAVAQMEAEAVSERTKQHAQWAKANGLYYGTNLWGMKKILIPGAGITSKGNPKCRLEWDYDFLTLMARFVDRLRNGEDSVELVDEFQGKYLDYRGKPFMVSYSRKGKINNTYSITSTRLTDAWCKNFIRELHYGRLPSLFCVPGVINKVDRGIAKGLKWIDRPDFVMSRKKPVKQSVETNRSDWSANDWKQWWENTNDNDNEDNEESDINELLSQIKIQANNLGLTTSQATFS